MPSPLSLESAKDLAAVGWTILLGDVDEDVAHGVAGHILSRALSSKPPPTIGVLIASCGGLVNAALCMVAALSQARARGIRTITYAVGDVMSAATYVLMAGERRYVSEGTVGMLHPMTLRTSSKNELGINMQISRSLLRHYTKIPAKEIDAILGGKEVYLTAREMTRLGIADRVIPIGSALPLSVL